MQSSSLANKQKVIGVLCIMPFFLGIVFLSYFGGSTLESAHIFAMMGMFAMIAAILAYQSNIRPFKWWDGHFNKQDLKWIGGAYAGLLALVFTITAVFGGSPMVVLLALTGGGVVLFVSLKKSESILVPWLVHSLYNFSALALASASIISLAASPIYVPNFAFDNRPTDIVTQFIMQFFFVAFSEEMLKVSITLGIFALTKRLNLAIAISIAFWVALHTVTAQRVFLPF